MPEAEWSNFPPAFLSRPERENGQEIVVSWNVRSASASQATTPAEVQEPSPKRRSFWIHHEDVGSVTVGAAAQGSVIREYISMYIYTADNILVVSE